MTGAQNAMEAHDRLQEALRDLVGMAQESEWYVGYQAGFAEGKRQAEVENSTPILDRLLREHETP